MNQKQVFESFPYEEQEGFQRSCEHHNYNRKEFEVFGVEAYERGRLVRTVTVARYGHIKNYDAGHETAWLVEFDADLRTKYFGEK